jgi:hypothetical protein
MILNQLYSNHGQETKMRKRISRTIEGMGWQFRAYQFMLRGTVDDAKLFWEMLNVPFEHIRTYILACYITAKTIEVAEKENIAISQSKLEEIVLEFVYQLTNEE